MPEAFKKATSKVISIPRANIDTDQICPARFLKITDKAGLADALFFDWRFTPDGARRNPPSFMDEPVNQGREFLLVGAGSFIGEAVLLLGTALVQGILTALRVPGPPWRFVLGCDMPGVDDAVLHALWRMASSSNALGCAVRKPGSERIDPLPSLWHVDVRRAVRGDWGLAARDWVRRAALALWTPPEAMAAQLVNLNTPEEWDEFVRRGSSPVMRP